MHFLLNYVTAAGSYNSYLNSTNFFCCCFGDFFCAEAGQELLEAIEWDRAYHLRLSHDCCCSAPINTFHENGIWASHNPADPSVHICARMHTWFTIQVCTPCSPFFLFFSMRRNAAGEGNARQILHLEGRMNNSKLGSFSGLGFSQSSPDTADMSNQFKTNSLNLTDYHETSSNKTVDSTPW